MVWVGRDLKDHLVPTPNFFSTYSQRSQLTFFASDMTAVSIFSGLCAYKGLKHFDDTLSGFQLGGSGWCGKKFNQTFQQRQMNTGSYDEKYHTALRQAEQL